MNLLMMVLKKMANYEEARVKLTNTPLKKLKSAAKRKTEITSRVAKKNVQDEELPQDKKAKINVFTKNLSTNLKLC